jgi:hypothetical protein
MAGLSRTGQQSACGGSKKSSHRAVNDEGFIQQ